ncbi:MAG: hypothetical protein Q9187_004371 [Circinaria calcarea]
MGLPKDLALEGNNFSNAATAFFIAYLIAEVPNVYLLQQVPAAKWLGLNVILWGIMTAITAAVHNYNGLLAVRILLGVFEATIGPSLLLISRLGFGQIVGGLLSFAFQHLQHDAIAGWRVMFIVLGLVTVIIGLGTALYLPDTPMKAKFLSEKEKVTLLQHVSINQTGIENRRFQWSQVWEAFRDIQIWLLVLITILQSVSSGVVTTYSTTLVKSLGFSSQNAALLNMPSGIVSIFFTLLVGFGIRHTSYRWAWIAMCSVPGIIGGGLMSFLPVKNTAGLLIGIYLVNAIVAPLPIIYHWTAANCAGQSKRAFASATVAGSFSIGNIIGPQTFQARDAPNYHPAKIAVLATQAAAAVMTFVLYLYYVYENRRRDARIAKRSVGNTQQPPTEVTTEAEAWGGKTDKQNMRFRYVY